MGGREGNDAHRLCANERGSNATDAHTATQLEHALAGNLVSVQCEPDAESDPRVPQRIPQTCAYTC